jgi:hypothetical protein
MQPRNAKSLKSIYLTRVVLWFEVSSARFLVLSMDEGSILGLYHPLNVEAQC